MHRRAETFSGAASGSDVNEILKADQHEHLDPGCESWRSSHLPVGEGIRPAEFPDAGAGRVLERQEIMHGVWGEFLWDDNLLDVYIRYLRQKVELDDAPTLIHTVRGVGFILREQSS